MDIYKQVCSITQAQELKEISIYSPPVYFWIDYTQRGPDQSKIITAEHFYDCGFLPDDEQFSAAYTSAELGVMLGLTADGSPSEALWSNKLHDWVSYHMKAGIHETEASFRAAIVIFAVIRELPGWTADEVNARLAAAG